MKQFCYWALGGKRQNNLNSIFFFHQAVTDLFLEMDNVVLIHFSVTLHVSNCLNRLTSQWLTSTHHLSIIYLLRRMINTDKLDIMHPAMQCWKDMSYLPKHATDMCFKWAVSNISPLGRMVWSKVQQLLEEGVVKSGKAGSVRQAAGWGYPWLTVQSPCLASSVNEILSLAQLADTQRKGRGRQGLSNCI